MLIYCTYICPILLFAIVVLFKRVFVRVTFVLLYYYYGETLHCVLYDIKHLY